MWVQCGSVLLSALNNQVKSPIEKRRIIDKLLSLVQTGSDAERLQSMLDWDCLESGCLPPSDLWNYLASESGHPEVDGGLHTQHLGDQLVATTTCNQLQIIKKNPSVCLGWL